MMVTDLLVEHFPQGDGPASSPATWRKNSTRSRRGSTSATRCSTSSTSRSRRPCKVAEVEDAGRTRRSVRCAASRWSSATASFGKFFGCSGYPECKYIKKKRRGQASASRPRSDRAHVPGVRQADAAAHGQARPVPGLQRLSRVQDDHELRRRGQAGPGQQADRARLRQVRQADGAARRAARPVPGLHRLSQVPQRQGRGCRGQPGQADRDRASNCEKCGSPMVVKRGPRGRSWAAAPIPSAAAPSRCRRN